MSYDVSIGDWSGNMTSNIGMLFYDHIPDMGKGGGLHELDGLTGKQCVDILAEAFTRIQNTRHRLWKENVIGEPGFCAKYDAKNGWGSAVGALIFLAEILGACALNPRKKVSVYA